MLDLIVAAETFCPGEAPVLRLLIAFPQLNADAVAGKIIADDGVVLPVLDGDAKLVLANGIAGDEGSKVAVPSQTP